MKDQEMAKTNILIADDERIIRLDLKEMLVDLGYEVVGEAADGRSLVNLARKLQPDVIITDIRMPNMDGLEAASIINQEKIAPVILLTAYSQIELVTKAKKAGVIGYLLKPFKQAELGPAIEVALERYRAHQYLVDTTNSNEAIGTRDLVDLAELGLLAAGIVHDLRSGLGIIRNTVDCLIDELEPDHPINTDLDKIIQSCTFCDLVIHNLAAIGSGELIRPRKLEIEPIIRDIFFMLESKLVDVELRLSIDPAVSQLVADEGQIQQVFMNLIKNAGEAMPDGGIVTIRTYYEQPFAVIEIADNGAGIPSENLPRVFDLRYTTKQRGFGIGLWVVSSVMKNHGGKIDVDSEIGKGTTFTLYFPMNQA